MCLSVVCFLLVTMYVSRDFYFVLTIAVLPSGSIEYLIIKYATVKYFNSLIADSYATATACSM